MSWLEKLRGGFKKTADRIGDNLDGLVSRQALDTATLDDIEEARAAGHMEDVLKYKAILKHFIEMHPESMRSG